MYAVKHIHTWSVLIPGLGRSQYNAWQDNFVRSSTRAVLGEDTRRPYMRPLRLPGVFSTRLRWYLLKVQICRYVSSRALCSNCTPVTYVTPFRASLLDRASSHSGHRFCGVQVCHSSTLLRTCAVFLFSFPYLIQNALPDHVTGRCYRTTSCLEM